MGSPSSTSPTSPAGCGTGSIWIWIRRRWWPASATTRRWVRWSGSVPGLRRIRYPESFEAAISTVLGQQVSLAAARTFAGRLVAAYGEPGPGGLTAFPAPERLAAAELEELRSAVGITGSRARTVLAVAELFARTGSWPVPLPREQWDERAAALLALPGIGPWTVAYLRMRLFGDPDAVPGRRSGAAPGARRDQGPRGAGGDGAVASRALVRGVPAVGVDRLVSSGHRARARISATSSSVSSIGLPRMLLARCVAATTSPVSASLSP